MPKFGIDTLEQLKGEVSNAVEDAKEKGVLEPLKEAGQYIYDKVVGESNDTAETKVRRRMQAPTKKARGGSVSSASKRADGCAIRGKTRA